MEMAPLPMIYSIWLRSFSEPDLPESSHPSAEPHLDDAGRVVSTRHGMHQGISIPWSQCHNKMISMKLVGPPGLEPSTKGL
jgi:hypothetical protein